MQVVKTIEDLYGLSSGANKSVVVKVPEKEAPVGDPVSYSRTILCKTSSNLAELHTSPDAPLSVNEKGRWSIDERLLFLHALETLGPGKWKRYQRYLPHRSLVQIKSHAQKVLARKRSGQDIFRLLIENRERLRCLVDEYLGAHLTMTALKQRPKKQRLKKRRKRTRKTEEEKTSETTIQNIMSCSESAAHGVDAPDADMPEACTFDTDKPEVYSSEVRTPEHTPEALRSEASTPQAHQQQLLAPEVVTPEMPPKKIWRPLAETLCEESGNGLIGNPLVSPVVDGHDFDEMELFDKFFDDVSILDDSSSTDLSSDLSHFDSSSDMSCFDL